ncbi:MAG: heme biosynthesis HemY N-terminal domain-containing protein [Acidovorax sp.]
MRAALWFLGLFGVAAAVALFAGNNQGTITVFWPPYRVDLSLNMVVILLAGGFVLLHTALRALSALLALPRQTRRWRLLQKERAMHGALLEALAYLQAGRFLRARKAAQAAIAQEEALHSVPHGDRLRALAHICAAESSHALQDRATRETHLQAALAAHAEEPALREGAQMRSARWALDDRDSEGALERLAALPQGAARRTLALRIRLKASRLAGHTQDALETARLLAKHRAFSPVAAGSIVRGLAAEQIHAARDPAQLQAIWMAFEPAERAMPELAIEAAQQLALLGGEDVQVRAWLLPVWERWAEGREPLQDPLPDAQAHKLVRALEASLSSIDGTWLARIEAAQQANPRDPRLAYLAGVACRERQLWGKAQQLLTQATQQLTASDRLHGSAWRHLAELAEQRGDQEAAVQAWRQV